MIYFNEGKEEKAHLDSRMKNTNLHMIRNEEMRWLEFTIQFTCINKKEERKTLTRNERHVRNLNDRCHNVKWQDVEKNVKKASYRILSAKVNKVIKESHYYYYQKFSKIWALINEMQ